MARILCLLPLVFVAAQAFVMPSVSPATSEMQNEAFHNQIPSVTEESSQEQSTAWRPLAIGAALGLFAAVIIGRAPAALAADVENGEAIFNGNCTACHAGGNNAIVPEKKLKKEALQTYGKYSVALIKQQVTNGNGAMPAFGEKLAPDDIEDVATYVLGQADKGW